MSIERPKNPPFVHVWAENAEEGKTRVNVPDANADHDNGHADIQTGFPKQTMISALQGGVPPWGAEHNGILNRITESVRWTQGGGLAQFDQEWANQVGGYAAGAVVRSNRFSYVFYINMQDGNRVDPDTGSKQEDYWINIWKPGNNWAISSILSDDSNNISYLDNNFRIVTKVAGAKTDVYVKPSTTKDKFLGTPEYPFRLVQEAIDSIPDGGTANIWLWYTDTYTLMADNTMNLWDRLGGGWNILSKKLSFIPWGQDEKDENGNYIDENGAMIQQLKDDLNAIHSSEDFFGFNLIKRPEIYIPVGKDAVNGMTIHGFISGTGGGSASFKCFHFKVENKQVENKSYQNGSPFHPQVTFNFNTCQFSNLDSLAYLYGGWGGWTNQINFSGCYMTDYDGNSTLKGKFIYLDEHTTTLTVNFNSKGEAEVFNQGQSNEHTYYHFYSNAVEFFSKLDNYSNAIMVPVAFNTSNIAQQPTQKYYYPRGLQTTLELQFGIN